MLDPAGELVTLANGDVEDKVGRPADNGMLGFIEPSCQMIGLHLYDGLFKVKSCFQCLPSSSHMGLWAMGYGVAREPLVANCLQPRAKQAHDPE